MAKQKSANTFRYTVTSKASPSEVYEVLANPSTYLAWTGEEVSSEGSGLLTLDAPKGRASVGTVWKSTGANSKDGSSTFHDRSTVTEASGNVFAFETNARLTRKRRPDWIVRFAHRYEVKPEGDGSRIDYIGDVYPENYRPYWLHPLIRPLFRVVVKKVDMRTMENLARFAEERSNTKH
jgi:hypothetical protein